MGLTGPIGGGKTAALEAFRRHGAAVVSADEIVHALYRREDVRAAVVGRLGSEVLAEDGTVDRARVGARVFADDGLRRWLEGLLHPLVAVETLRRLDELSRAVPPPRLVVNEVPLLFEVGLEGRYDRTLVVTAPAALRRARLERRGVPVDLAAREARLLPVEEKVARADDVIENGGGLGELDDQVAAYVARLAPCAG